MTRQAVPTSHSADGPRVSRRLSGWSSADPSVAGWRACWARGLWRSAGCWLSPRCWPYWRASRWRCGGLVTRASRSLSWAIGLPRWPGARSRSAGPAVALPGGLFCRKDPVRSSGSAGSAGCEPAWCGSGQTPRSQAPPRLWGRRPGRRRRRTPSDLLVHGTARGAPAALARRSPGLVGRGHRGGARNDGPVARGIGAAYARAAQAVAFVRATGAAADAPGTGLGWPVAGVARSRAPCGTEGGPARPPIAVAVGVAVRAVAGVRHLRGLGAGVGDPLAGVRTLRIADLDDRGAARGQEPSCGRGGHRRAWPGSGHLDPRGPDPGHRPAARRAGPGAHLEPRACRGLRVDVLLGPRARLPGHR